MGYVLRKNSERHSVLQRELSRTVELLKGMGVTKLILFGSLAGDDPETAWDIDLMVIMHTRKRFLDRLEEVYRVVQPRVSTDILVYTPEEFETMLRDNSFVREAVKKGKILHEAQ